MIWYVIGSIPLILFIVYNVRDRIRYNKRKKERVYTCKDETPLGVDWIIIGIAGLICLGSIIWLAGSGLTGGILYSFKGNTEEYHTSWNITAMQDNFNTHGKFYIRSGYIETDLYYYYFYSTKNGLKSSYIPANKTYLNYTTDKPHIERYTRKWSKSWIKWFTCQDAQDYATNDVYYKAYVPEGSVEQSFNVDLQ